MTDLKKYLAKKIARELIALKAICNNTKQLSSNFAPWLVDEDRKALLTLIAKRYNHYFWDNYFPTISVNIITGKAHKESGETVIYVPSEKLKKKEEKFKHLENELSEKQKELKEARTNLNYKIMDLDKSKIAQKNFKIVNIHNERIPSLETLIKLKNERNEKYKKLEGENYDECQEVQSELESKSKKISREKEGTKVKNQGLRYTYIETFENYVEKAGSKIKEKNDEANKLEASKSNNTVDITDEKDYQKKRDILIKKGEDTSAFDYQYEQKKNKQKEVLQEYDKKIKEIRNEIAHLYLEVEKDNFIKHLDKSYTKMKALTRFLMTFGEQQEIITSFLQDIDGKNDLISENNSQSSGTSWASPNSANSNPNLNTNSKIESLEKAKKKFSSTLENLKSSKQKLSDHIEEINKKRLNLINLNKNINTNKNEQLIKITKIMNFSANDFRKKIINTVRQAEFKNKFIHSINQYLLDYILALDHELINYKQYYKSLMFDLNKILQLENFSFYIKTHLEKILITIDQQKTQLEQNPKKYIDIKAEEEKLACLKKFCSNRLQELSNISDAIVIIMDSKSNDLEPDMNILTSNITLLVKANDPEFYQKNLLNSFIKLFNKNFLLDYADFDFHDTFFANHEEKFDVFFNLLYVPIEQRANLINDYKFLCGDADPTEFLSQCMQYFKLRFQEELIKKEFEDLKQQKDKIFENIINFIEEHRELIPRSKATKDLYDKIFHDETTKLKEEGSKSNVKYYGSSNGLIGLKLKEVNTSSASSIQSAITEDAEVESKQSQSSQQDDFGDRPQFGHKGGKS